MGVTVESTSTAWQGVFWRSFCPRSLTESDDATQQLERTIDQTALLSTSAAHVREAFIAVSMLARAQKDVDRRKEQDSIREYIFAMCLVRCALENREERNDDALLVSCMLLELYELCDYRLQRRGCPDWVVHAQGLGHLIEHRGVASADTADHLECYLVNRLPIIYAAMYTRTSTFWATEPWRGLGWSDSTKLPLDHVIRLAALVPDLLVQYDKSTWFPPDASRDEMLLESSLALMASLQTWFETRPDDYVPIALDPSLAATNHHIPVARPLGFLHPASWVANVVAWFCALVITENLVTLSRRLCGTRPRHRQPNTDKPELRPRDYALQIIRSIRFAGSPVVGPLDKYHIQVPMCWAVEWLRKNGMDPGDK